MRKVLVVLLILLVGGLIAADRIGVRVVQDEIGKRIAAQHGLQRQPEVTIHGFPFLTQAIGGEYDQIDVLIDEYTEQNVTVTGVRVEMHGVRAPLSEVMSGNTANVTARTATASAVIPYDAIQREAPDEVRRIAASGTELKVDLAGTIAGIPLNGTAIVSVAATSEGVRITPRSIGTGGVQIPVNLLQQRLAWTVPVRDLPVGSRISQVQVTPSGLRVGATAENVNLGNLSTSS